ncbi:MAG: DNA cytosine methyltransferase [Oscillospiraceae bacterium]|nr:DNA cytosine methyltransferase [Oscillospiraceae bacterium]
MNQKIDVVSLFDGISCGRVALDRAGITVNSYSAFEIDKYAKAVSRYNYPDIQQCGNVFDADFRRFAGYNIVIGGSPCTFWSCARSANREVDKSGIGWKLFMRFVEAVRVISPCYFLYENVASMPQNIKRYISEELGVKPILINSALLSAQSRKRLYWTNIRGVTQPDDKRILLQDILETGVTARNKSYCIDACYYKSGNHTRPLSQAGKRQMVYEPVRVGSYGTGGQGNRIYSIQGKSVSLMANDGGRGGKVGLYKVDLPDGDYIIRKLTPVETERCQTLPDNYTAFGIDDSGKTVNISNTQRYKCIGNGWTVDVITHILSFADI